MFTNNRCVYHNYLYISIWHEQIPSYLELIVLFDTSDNIFNI